MPTPSKTSPTPAPIPTSAPSPSAATPPAPTAPESATSPAKAAPAFDFDGFLAAFNALRPAKRTVIADAIFGAATINLTSIPLRRFSPVQRPNPPKVPATAANRATLIKQKIARGLSKSQAEASVDAQIARDAVLTGSPTPTATAQS